MATALTVEKIFKGYPAPKVAQALVEPTEDDYCVMGIACDYAQKHRGWAQGDKRNLHFPGAWTAAQALRSLNPVLTSYKDVVYDLAGYIIGFNDKGQFDKAKQCLADVLAFTGGDIAPLVEKWCRIADGDEATVIPAPEPEDPMKLLEDFDETGF